jgi:preprotein translocase subunit YajC
MNPIEALVALSRNVVLLQTGPQPGAPQQDLGQVFAGIFPMLVILFVVMYLFAIRPQRKQEQEKKKMLDSLKKNDRVVTIGGIHGTVSAVKAETVLLTVADNVQLKLSKSAIQRILRKGESEDEGEEPFRSAQAS